MAKVIFCNRATFLNETTQFITIDRFFRKFVGFNKLRNKMEAEKITLLTKVLPQQSQQSYIKEYKQFVEYSGLRSTYDEADVCRYFEYLKETKKLAPTTLWTRYSCINSCLSIVNKQRLQDFPLLTRTLKSYEKGWSKKKAKTFSVQDIRLALSTETTGPFWLVRKAALACAFTGGLRLSELRSLSMEGINLQDDGYWINFTGSKQRGCSKDSNFLVPFNRDEPRWCFATQITNYRMALEDQLGKNEIRRGALFRGCHGGKRFVTHPMGVNVLANIGKDFAELLGLSNPESYTSHTFRRSAAGSAADAGCSSFMLKQHMRWADEKMASEYVDKSKCFGRQMASYITGKPIAVHDSNKIDDLPKPETKTRRMETTHTTC